MGNNHHNWPPMISITAIVPPNTFFNTAIFLVALQWT